MSIPERVQQVLDEIEAQRPEALLVPYEDRGAWEAWVEMLPYAYRPKRVLGSTLMARGTVILIPDRVFEA